MAADKWHKAWRTLLRTQPTMLRSAAAFALFLRDMQKELAAEGDECLKSIAAAPEALASHGERA